MATDTKLTPAIADAIVAHLEEYVSLNTAAALVGVRAETLKTWVRKGADARRRLDRVTDESRAYAELHKRVEGAIARQKLLFAKYSKQRAEDIETATGVSRGDPKPLAHLMAVLHPREFNRVVRVEVDNEMSAGIERLYRGMPPEQAALAVALLTGADDIEGSEPFEASDSGEESAVEEGE